MDECKKKILLRSLAMYVAHRESTDIILTTENLTTLFGSVYHAIDESIRSEKSADSVNIESGQTRFRYSSKATAEDRLFSKHPTVKPIALMRWLVRLVTPPGGTVLDCFAGTGTTAHAALLEGFNSILCERDAEYISDIERRMALVFAGDVERASHRESESHEGLPLFGGTDDAGGARANTAATNPSSSSDPQNHRANRNEEVKT
jgi:hypothetical protein